MTNSTKQIRLAVLVTHPVQYFQPVFKDLSATPGIDLLVFYGCNHGLVASFDADFSQKIAWDSDLITGFRSRFVSKGLLSSLNSWMKSLQLAVKANHMINSFEPDFVLVYAYTPLFISLTTLLLKFTGNRLLLRADGTDRALPRGALKSLIRDIVLRAWYHLFLHIFPIGHYSDEHFARLGVSKLKRTSVPFAVNVEYFNQQVQYWMPKRAQLRQKYGIKTEDIVLLWSGKMTSIKNPMLLIKAIASLPSEIKQRIFLMAMGDGPLFKDFQARANEYLDHRCYFLGFCNQSEMGRGYACADVLVFPSCMGETWGLVVNEALQFGLAVISSDHPGCVGDLFGGQFEIPKGSSVFSNGDELALAQALTSFVNHYTKGYIPKPVKGLPSPFALAEAITHQMWRYLECAANHSPNTTHRQ